MEKTKEYSEAVAEALEVLQMANEDVIKKIPLEVIQQMNKNKSKTYKSKFDVAKPIKESDLSGKTKAILAFLYRDYICPEEERAEINKMLYENEQEVAKEELKEVKEVEEPKDVKVEKEADKPKEDVTVKENKEDEKLEEVVDAKEEKVEEKKDVQEDTNSKEFVNVLPAAPKKSLIRRIIENFFFYDDET